MSSVETAADYAGRMVDREIAMAGNVETAMRRIEAKTGVGYWVLWSLRYKPPKAIATDLFLKIRTAYFAMCERQIATLMHELAIEKARCGNDALSDIEIEVEDLVERLRRAQQQASRP